MVLLKGLNYDYSGQVGGIITQGIAKSSTALMVSKTVGIEVDDYLVINPKGLTSEIVQVTAVDNYSKLTVTSLKFNHTKNELYYRIPYNQMRFYQADTIAGTYTVIDTINMNYNDLYTNYTHDATDKFYKRTFYNEETTVESDIEDSEAWQVTDEELYVTEQEMRSFLQFETDDFPTQADIRFFLKTAIKRINLDVEGKDSNILFIATLLLGKHFILRSLATKTLAKGYIQATVEGRTITKAYQELVLEAENVYQEYKEFLVSNARREASSTNFMTDTTIISSLTRQEMIDMMNGTTNAENAQMARKYDYFWRR